MKFWAHGYWDSRNRPIVSAWWDDDNCGLGLDWGNGNSDPVWSVGVIFNETAHPRLARLAGWIEGRRLARFAGR